MITYDFKAGNGSSSRQVEIAGEHLYAGCLRPVQLWPPRRLHHPGRSGGPSHGQDQLRGKDQGSVIAIVATDAPLMAHQLKRIARRVPMGLARTGTVGNNSSGDIFSPFRPRTKRPLPHGMVRQCLSWHSRMAASTPCSARPFEATEEAVIDSMLCNQTMVGGMAIGASPFRKINSWPSCVKRDGFDRDPVGVAWCPGCPGACRAERPGARSKAARLKAGQTVFCQARPVRPFSWSRPARSGLHHDGRRA